LDDPAFEVLYPVSQARQIGARIGASVADMAVDDKLLVPGKLIHTIPKFLKREKTGSLDGLRFVLLGRPYIKKDKVLP
jgi:hypothetical protein